MSARAKVPVFSPRAVTVRAHLSGTPLSRRHEQTVSGKLARLPKPQPWAAFREAEHPRAARALATDFWLGVARGEYAAVGLFAELAIALSRQGAPFDFVHAATQAATDETRHAELCLRMAACTAGGEQTAELKPGELGFGLPPLQSEEALDFMMLEAVAVSETLATALLTACQRRATDRLSKSLLTALVSDEVHHARLGWYYLAERAPRWSLAERQRLADACAATIFRVEEQFWIGRDAPRGAGAAARALGVLDSRAQRATIRDVMENEILPGLDALGLGASKAWSVRPKARARA